MKNPTVDEDVSLHSILETIGRELYSLRVGKGYTSHVDFASDHGLPRIQYWRMEKGKANITLRSLGKVLAIHNLTLEEFLGRVLRESIGKKQAEKK